MENYDLVSDKLLESINTPVDPPKAGLDAQGRFVAPTPTAAKPLTMDQLTDQLVRGIKEPEVTDTYKKKQLFRSDALEPYIQQGLSFTTESLETGSLQKTAYQSQDSWDKLGYSLKISGANAVATFVGQMLEIPQMAENVLGDDNKFETLSPIAEWRSSVQNANTAFRTPGDDTQGIGGYLLPNWITGNTQSIWGSALESAGYATGAIAGFAVQEAAVSALTGGTGTFPLLGAKLFQGARYLSKLGKVEKLRDGFKALEATANALKVSRAYNVGKTLSKNVLRSAYSSYVESAFEALEGKERISQELMKDYFDIHGEEATGDALEEIKQATTAATDARFWANYIGLTISNMPFSRAMFAPFDKSLVTKDVLKRFGQKISKDGKLVDDVVEFTGEAWTKNKYLSKIKKPAEYVYNKAINSEVSWAEGLEEGYQTIVENGVENYFTNDYNKESNQTFLGGIEEGLRAVGSGAGSLATEEGVKSMLAGIFGGAYQQAGISGVQYAMGKTKKKQLDEVSGEYWVQDGDKYVKKEYTVRESIENQVKESAGFAKELVKDAMDPATYKGPLREQFEGYQRQFASATEMLEAKGEITFRENQSVARFHSILPYVSKGGKDFLIDRIKEEVEGNEGITDKQTTINSLISDVETVDKYYQKMQQTFANPFNPNSKTNAEAYSMYEHLKNIGTYHLFQLDQQLKSKEGILNMYGDTLVSNTAIKEIKNFWQQAKYGESVKETRDKIYSIYQRKIDKLQSDLDLETTGGAILDREKIKKELAKLKKIKQQIGLALNEKKKNTSKKETYKLLDQIYESETGNPLLDINKPGFDNYENIFDNVFSFDDLTEKINKSLEVIKDLQDKALSTDVEKMKWLVKYQQVAKDMAQTKNDFKSKQALFAALDFAKDIIKQSTLSPEGQQEAMDRIDMALSKPKAVIDKEFVDTIIEEVRKSDDALKPKDKEAVYTAEPKLTCFFNRDLREPRKGKNQSQGDVIKFIKEYLNQGDKVKFTINNLTQNGTIIEKGAIKIIKGEDGKSYTLWEVLSSSPQAKIINITALDKLGVQELTEEQVFGKSSVPTPVPTAKQTNTPPPPAPAQTSTPPPANTQNPPATQPVFVKDSQKIPDIKILSVEDTIKFSKSDKYEEFSDYSAEVRDFFMFIKMINLFKSDKYVIDYEEFKKLDYALKDNLLKQVFGLNYSDLGFVNNVYTDEYDAKSKTLKSKVIVKVNGKESIRYDYFAPKNLRNIDGIADKLRNNPLLKNVFKLVDEASVVDNQQQTAATSTPSSSSSSATNTQTNTNNEIPNVTILSKEDTKKLREGKDTEQAFSDYVAEVKDFIMFVKIINSIKKSEKYALSYEEFRKLDYLIKTQLVKGIFRLDYANIVFSNDEFLDQYDPKIKNIKTRVIVRVNGKDSYRYDPFVPAELINIDLTIKNSDPRDRPILDKIFIPIDKAPRTDNQQQVDTGIKEQQIPKVGRMLGSNYLQLGKDGRTAEQKEYKEKYQDFLNFIKLINSLDSDKYIVNFDEYRKLDDNTKKELLGLFEIIPVTGFSNGEFLDIYDPNTKDILRRKLVDINGKVTFKETTPYTYNKKNIDNLIDKGDASFGNAFELLSGEAKKKTVVPPTAAPIVTPQPAKASAQKIPKDPTKTKKDAAELKKEDEADYYNYLNEVKDFLLFIKLINAFKSEKYTINYEQFVALAQEGKQALYNVYQIPNTIASNNDETLAEVYVAGENNVREANGKMFKPSIEKNIDAVIDNQKSINGLLSKVFDIIEEQSSVDEVSSGQQAPSTKEDPPVKDVEDLTEDELAEILDEISDEELYIIIESLYNDDRLPIDFDKKDSYIWNSERGKDMVERVAKNEGPPVQEQPGGNETDDISDLETKKADIEIPKLLTVKVDLASLTIEELNNVAKQLRQKAVNAREVEKQDKSVISTIGGSAAVEGDYQLVKKYIAELEVLEREKTNGNQSNQSEFNNKIAELESKREKELNDLKNYENVTKFSTLESVGLPKDAIKVFNYDSLQDALDAGYKYLVDQINNKYDAEIIEEIDNEITRQKKLEQNEYAAMNDPSNETERQRIYDKYNLIIAPLMDAKNQKLIEKVEKEEEVLIDTAEQTLGDTGLKATVINEIKLDTEKEINTILNGTKKDENSTVILDEESSDRNSLESLIIDSSWIVVGDKVVSRERNAPFTSETLAGISKRMVNSPSGGILSGKDMIDFVNELTWEVKTPKQDGKTIKLGSKVNKVSDDQSFNVGLERGTSFTVIQGSKDGNVLLTIQNHNIVISQEMYNYVNKKLPLLKNIYPLMPFIDFMNIIDEATFLDLKDKKFITFRQSFSETKELLNGQQLTFNKVNEALKSGGNVAEAISETTDSINLIMKDFENDKQLLSVGEEPLPFNFIYTEKGGPFYKEYIEIDGNGDIRGESVEGFAHIFNAIKSSNLWKEGGLRLTNPRIDEKTMEPTYKYPKGVYTIFTRSGQDANTNSVSPFLYLAKLNEQQELSFALDLIDEDMDSEEFNKQAKITITSESGNWVLFPGFIEGNFRLRAYPSLYIKPEVREDLIENDKKAITISLSPKAYEKFKSITNKAEMVKFLNNQKRGEVGTINTITVWKKSKEDEFIDDAMLKNSTIVHKIGNVQYRIIPKKIRDIPVKEVPLDEETEVDVVKREYPRQDFETSDFEYIKRKFDGDYIKDGTLQNLEFTPEMYSVVANNEDKDFIEAIEQAVEPGDFQNVYDEFFNVVKEDNSEQLDKLVLYKELSERLDVQINKKLWNIVDLNAINNLTDIQILAIKELLSDKDLSDDNLLAFIESDASEYMTEEETSRMLHIKIMTQSDNVVPPFREVFNKDQREVLNYLLKNCR